MMFCPKCGNELENNAKFCPKCGTPLGNNELPNLSESVMKFLHNMTLVVAGLQILVTILWFIPTIYITGNGGSLWQAVSYSEWRAMSYSESVINIAMVILGIASVVTMILPIIKNNIQKHRNYIMAKVTASIYMVLLLMEVIGGDAINEGKYQFHLAFCGYLYLAACVAIIVLTVIMALKTKIKK